MTTNRNKMRDIQTRLFVLGFDPGLKDGLWGPKTQKAVMRFQKQNGLAIDGKVGPKTWAMLFAQDSPWPKQSDVESFYGKPGENLAQLSLPYPMRLSWEKSKTITKITLHKRVIESAGYCFEKIAQAYDGQTRQDLGLDCFGGSYAKRVMRETKTLSMHAWGIAIDFDPERNQMKWGEAKARLAQKDCETFWKIFEDEGWVSLGRTRNFDWMHVQAARL